MEKKASEVVQLGDECPGGHRVDPVEAAQPGRAGRIQHACVPPIRLDPIPRRARDQRRRDDLAREALLRQFSLEFVAARPRLIRTQNRPGRFALSLPNQTLHRPGFMRNRSLLTAPARGIEPTPRLCARGHPSLRTGYPLPRPVPSHATLPPQTATREFFHTRVIPRLRIESVVP